MRVCTVIVAAALLAAGPALAFGSSSGESSGDQYKKAVKAVEAKDFATAETLLTQYLAQKDKDADALNYLAYSQRNLGKTEEAMANYVKALAIDPNHKGALEYQGELFLKLGNLAAAQANLARLEAVCKKKCEERDTLQAAIERAKDGQTSWVAPPRSNAAGL
jgi:predicted Zn-dependent protease